MKKITVKELNEKLKNNEIKWSQVIDVRTPAEYRGVHVEKIHNFPLEKIPTHMDDFKKNDEIYVMCNSGNRSQMAISDLGQHGFVNLTNVEGGIQAWIKEKFPVIRTTSFSMPIIQQVMIIAGAVVLTGTLGHLFIAEWMIWLAVAIASGMFYAGVSGDCRLSNVLAKMPWNK
jgi:rhodanese-related sulfurtransferase